MRPRGTPPTPSARSTDSAPVGIAATLTAKRSSPSRISEPWPNSFSIWLTAALSAAPRTGSRSGSFALGLPFLSLLDSLVTLASRVTEAGRSLDPRKLGVRSDGLQTRTAVCDGSRPSCEEGALHAAFEARRRSQLLAVGIELDASDLAVAEAPYRARDQFDLCVHVVSTGAIPDEDDDTLAGFDHVVDLDVIGRPGLQPVEPHLAKALDPR